MNVLVATDGMLDPGKAAEAVARLHQDGDDVVVYTASNFPSEFLSRMSESGVKAASDIALAAGHQLGSGDRVAERLSTNRPSAVPAGDSPMAGVLEATARNTTDPVLSAIKAKGIDAHAAWSTTENRTAKWIMAYARQHDSDIIVIGSHGHGRFGGIVGIDGYKARPPCSG